MFSCTTTDKSKDIKEELSRDILIALTEKYLDDNRVRVTRIDGANIMLRLGGAAGGPRYFTIKVSESY